VGDPRVDQPQMKDNLSFLQEACLPTMPWGCVGDQLEEEMNPFTTYWRTRTSLDLQEDPSPLPGDPRVDHHRRLDAVHLKMSEGWRKARVAVYQVFLTCMEIRSTYSDAGGRYNV
jgi:hypothetical protein